MAHVLKKYFSCRGSALFMVLSTMTALMIAAMAMYFSVISSRQVQYAVFYEEQAYQSSVSIADAIIAGLNDGKLNGLQSEILKLTTGDTASSTLSTNGNDFKTFVGEVGTRDDADQIGAYDVNISRLADSNGCQVYDFCVTAAVNGVQETTHTMVMMKPTEKKFIWPNNLFTATGYTPSTNFIGMGIYSADMDIDSQSVIFGLNGVDEGQGIVGPTIMRNLTCAGNAEFYSVNPVSEPNPRIWAFGGDLILHNDVGSYHNADALDMHGTGKQPGILYVGGDLHAEDIEYFQIKTNDIVYVVGNFYGHSIELNGKLLVGGELHINETGPWYSPIRGKGMLVLTDETKIIKNSDKTSFMPYHEFDIIKWSDLGPQTDSNIHTSITAVKQALTDIIGPIVYPLWTVDWDKIGGYSEDTVLFNGGTYGTVEYNGKDEEGHIISTTPIEPRLTYTSEELTYSEGNHGCKLKNIIDVAEYGTDCTIDGNPILDQHGNLVTHLGSGVGGNSRRTIIVDTGDDPENVFYLGLEANHRCDIAGETINIFSWHTSGSDNYTDTNAGTNVLVRGRGSLVMVLPKDVVYQSTTNDFIGHENWYFLLGGTTINDGTYGLCYGSVKVLGDNVRKFLHIDCRDKQKCYVTGDDQNGYWCETHECYVDKAPTDDGECGCKFRVGRKEIDKMLGSNNYPTVNIWLVSEDANADMRFTTVINDKNDRVIGNTFFGYIYAPYMSFVADTGTRPPEGGTRIVGGLIVSNVIINDWNEFVFVIPEKTYADIGDFSNSGKPDVSWRVYGY